MDFCQCSVILHSSHKPLKTLRERVFVRWLAHEPRVWMYDFKVKNEMKDGLEEVIY